MTFGNPIAIDVGLPVRVEIDVLQLLDESEYLLRLIELAVRRSDDFCNRVLQRRSWGDVLVQVLCPVAHLLLPEFFLIWSWSVEEADLINLICERRPKCLLRYGRYVGQIDGIVSRCFRLDRGPGRKNRGIPNVGHRLTMRSVKALSSTPAAPSLLRSGRNFSAGMNA